MTEKQQVNWKDFVDGVVRYSLAAQYGLINKELVVKSVLFSEQINSHYAVIYKGKLFYQSHNLGAAVAVYNELGEAQ